LSATGTAGQRPTLEALLHVHRKQVGNWRAAASGPCSDEPPSWPGHEYLWKAAWSLHPADDPAAEDWVAVKALAVLAGGSGRAAAAITAEAAAGLTGSQRAGADTCVRYLTSKHELLRYDQALQAGWPIATGIIEGACRHLIADLWGSRTRTPALNWDFTRLARIR
jgi:hypothetical protein